MESEVELCNDGERRRKAKSQGKSSGGLATTSASKEGSGTSRSELAQKDSSGPWGLEAGQSVEVRVDTRQPRNPRMIYCMVNAPDGADHRVIVRVLKSENFRPNMELTVTVPPISEEREPWPYSGRMPRHRGLWGTPGPRGRAV
jgi:hypothetical protein